MAFAKTVARLLDDWIEIPGTSFKIGLDPLIGLIPGLGDLLAGLLATVIIVQAIEQNLPRVTVLRMALNLLIDTAVGSVPFLGDIFDAAFKANVRNVALLESGLASGRTRGRRDLGFLVAVVGGLVLCLVGFATGGLWLLARLRDFIVAH